VPKWARVGAYNSRLIVRSQTVTSDAFGEGVAPESLKFLFRESVINPENGLKDSALINE